MSSLEMRKAPDRDLVLAPESDSRLERGNFPLSLCHLRAHL